MTKYTYFCIRQWKNDKYFSIFTHYNYLLLIKSSHYLINLHLNPPQRRRRNSYNTEINFLTGEEICSAYAAVKSQKQSLNWWIHVFVLYNKRTLTLDYFWTRRKLNAASVWQWVSLLQMKHHLTNTLASGNKLDKSLKAKLKSSCRIKAWICRKKHFIQPWLYNFYSIFLVSGLKLSL